MEKTVNKLLYKVKNKIDFSKEDNFLEVVLKSYGVKDVSSFLNPKLKDTHDPFLMKNMKEAVEKIHELSEKKLRILIPVDPDCDGFFSSALLKQFFKEVIPNWEVVYRLDYEKRHGLNSTDVKKLKSIDLIIIPDASFEGDIGEQVKNKYDIPIIIFDHHIISDPTIHNYALVVNCTDGTYPNPTLSGVGVAYKFCLAYCEQYGLNPELVHKYLDLVALGQIADSVDLTNLETRYYTLMGLKENRMNNDFIKELIERNSEDMKFGPTLMNVGWTLAPKINGCIRYGKKDEQEELFRAISGEQEEIAYQPRRKSKFDDKPEVEMHTLQWDAARVCNNVKNRQDAEVRRFLEKLIGEIDEKKLDKNSILFVDGSDIIEKSTVTGLIANKLATKYKRPVVLMRNYTDSLYGGSARNYSQGKIDDLMVWLNERGLTCRGHASACGIEFEKNKLDEIIARCNQDMPLDTLCTIFEVDYAIEAENLTKENVSSVAESYKVWGNNVKEPLFYISGIEISASEINAYGDNQGFIRFVYNGIPFIRKYAPHGMFEEMTLKTRNTLGENTKRLKLNIIGNFVLNEYNGEFLPQVKIQEFDVEEVSIPVDVQIENDLKKSKNKRVVKAVPVSDNENFDDDFNELALIKKKKPKIDIDDDFVF